MECTNVLKKKHPDWLCTAKPTDPSWGTVVTTMRSLARRETRPSFTQINSGSMPSTTKGLKLPNASSNNEALRKRYAELAMALTSTDLEETTETKVQDLESKGQITIHIRVKSRSMIRIWPCIKLRCQQTGKEAKFVHALDVGIHPYWMLLAAGSVYTLVFEKLDDDCRVFDVVEKIPEFGGLYIPNLHRNEDDVYHLREA